MHAGRLQGRLRKRLVPELLFVLLTLDEETRATMGQQPAIPDLWPLGQCVR